MKNYLILLCFAASITVHGMQLSMYTITFRDSNTYESTHLEQYAMTQLFNAPKKRVLIIDDKRQCSFIDAEHTYNYHSKRPNPQQTALHNADLNQYNLALCVINPDAYNQEKKQFDSSLEKKISFLANSALKTHYFILSPTEQMDKSPISNNINDIYAQANVKKYAQFKKTYTHNIHSSLYKRCLQRLYKSLSHLIASLGKKVTSIPFLCLIIRLTDHPAFPLPSVQPFILQGLPLIIMLKTFLA